MRGGIIRAFIVALAVAASPLSAMAGQAGENRPAVETGVRLVGLGTSGDAGLGGGVSATWNLDPRTAIETSVDFRTHTTPGERSSSRFLYLQLKRTLFASGPNRFYGTVGGVAGFSRTTFHVPAFPSGAPISQTFQRGTGGFVAGAGYDRMLGRHLALDLQAQVVIGDNITGVRTTVGLAVPLGAFARRTAATDEPRAAAFSGLDIGQTAWVTTADGTEWKGRVTRLSTSAIEFATSKGTTALALSEIRRIEAPDRLLDGVVRGTLIGLTAGIPAFVLGFAWEDGGYGFLLGVAWSGIGAGTGALIGAIADSLHEGRRVVYRAGETHVSLSPIVVKKGAGVGATIRW